MKKVAKHDVSLLDAPLSEEGHSQCIKGQQNALNLMPNAHIVFVSPLERALQTAYNCFKEHPKFGEIKFILLPDLKE